MKKEEYVDPLAYYGVLIMIIILYIVLATRIVPDCIVWPALIVLPLLAVFAEGDGNAGKPKVGFPRAILFAEIAVIGVILFLFGSSSGSWLLVATSIVVGMVGVGVRFFDSQYLSRNAIFNINVAYAFILLILALATMGIQQSRNPDLYPTIVLGYFSIVRFSGAMALTLR